MQNNVKLDRAKARLARGEPLNLLPRGGYKFGGNKFIPDNVAYRLLSLCLPGEQNNRGWTVYRPDAEKFK